MSVPELLTKSMKIPRLNVCLNSEDIYCCSDAVHGSSNQENRVPGLQGLLVKGKS